MKVRKITVTERGRDFHACLYGDPRRWEAGRTPSLAVTKLLVTYAAELGIEIDDRTDLLTGQ